MTLIKINPEDLVIGREYYVKLRLNRIDTDWEFPLVFMNNRNHLLHTPQDQPIYTHEPSTDTELEMLVNVASRIYTDTLRSEPIDECVKKAQKIITACKNALKEVSHD